MSFATFTDADPFALDFAVPSTPPHPTNDDDSEFASLPDDLLNSLLDHELADTKMESSIASQSVHYHATTLPEPNTMPNSIEGLAAAIGAPPSPGFSQFFHQFAQVHRRPLAGSYPDGGHAAILEIAELEDDEMLGCHANSSLPECPDVLTPVWNGIIPDSFWDLEEEMMALISYKDLAKLMAKSKLTEKQISDAKKLRRRVKNRQSARVCTTRKRVQVHKTENTNDQLHEQIQMLTVQNQALTTQNTTIDQQVTALRKSEAEAVREKLAMQAEVQRMQVLLEQALQGMGDPQHHELTLPLPGSLFAIAA